MDSTCQLSSRFGLVVGLRWCTEDRLGQPQLWHPCTLIQPVVSPESLTTASVLCLLASPSGALYTKFCRTRSCLVRSRVIPKGGRSVRFSGNPHNEARCLKMPHLMLGPIACTSLVLSQQSQRTRVRCCPSSVPSGYYQEITVTLVVLKCLLIAGSWVNIPIWDCHLLW